MSLHASDLFAVQRLPLFASVPKANSAQLFHAARLHEFGADSVLFREGEMAESLYIALDGHVALKAKGRDAHETIIEFVSPGQPFIIAAALLNRPFLMSAQVLETSRVILIPADDFRHSVATDLAFSTALNHCAAEHWRAMIGQVKSLKMRNGSQRLAAFLLSLVDRRTGEATVRLPCERRMIASWLGMVPTSASRAFRELAAIGVEGPRDLLRIRSLQILCDFAEQRPSPIRMKNRRQTALRTPSRNRRGAPIIGH